MRTRFFVSVFLLVAVNSGLTAPKSISYQGRLTDPTGNPISGMRNLQFSIFSQPTGGSVLWMEMQTVSVADGLFSVELGIVNPIPDSAFASNGAWLETMVDTDPPISPRAHLAAVPYSRLSHSVSGAGPVSLHESDPSSGDSGGVYIGRNESSSTNPEYEWKVVNNRPASASSASIHTVISADSGVIETTTAQNGAAQATGKRQHKPVVITKEWGATDGTNSVELKSSVHADSGFSESKTLSTPVATVESHEVGHSFGHGHLDFLKQVSDPATGDLSKHEMWLEPDSGVSETTTTESSSGLATGKRTHKPISIKASSMTLSGADTAYWERSVEIDSGYSERAGMTKADLISEIMQQSSQTREHVLLARQVGVPGSTTSASVELENTNNGPRIQMTRQGTSANPSDDGVVVLDGSLPGGAAFEMSAVNGLNSSLFSAMVSSDTGVVITVYIDGDEATSSSASTDKRKQSLYFPESMHSALDLLVDGAASMIILKKLQIASGAVDSNVVIDNDGNAKLAGALTIGGAQGTVANATSFTVPRITTSQRNALAAVNGMVIYNTTTNQFNFYENGAWVTK